MRNKWTNIVIDSLYLFVGISAMLVSVKFSYQFFMYNGYTFVWSMILAIIYVIFLNLLFENGVSKFTYNNVLAKEMEKFNNKEVVTKYRKNIRNNYIIGSLILLSWLILAFYSIVSTIGGQYEQLSKIQLENPQEIGMSAAQVPILKEQMQLKETQRDSFKNEMAMIEKRLNTVEDIEKSFEYKRTSEKNEERLDLLRSRIDTINAEINDIYTQIINIQLSQTTIVKGSVYTYFERVTGVSKLIIQFVLSFFPSIVVDFFAAISFSMFLHRRKMISVKTN